MIRWVRSIRLDPFNDAADAHLVVVDGLHARVAGVVPPPLSRYTVAREPSGCWSRTASQRPVTQEQHRDATWNEFIVRRPRLARQRKPTITTHWRRRSDCQHHFRLSQ